MGEVDAPLRVLVAPDSFKGTLRATDVARTIAQEWRRLRPADTVTELPMADGGEGTIDAFEAAHPGSTRVPITVTGPGGGEVDAYWLHIPRAGDGGIGVVELAGTSGIELMARLDALHAHTIGFGQAIASALDHGVHQLVLAIGSSASTDSGTGMLTALGARITDANDTPLPPGGVHLRNAHRVDLRRLRPLPPGGVTVLTDVTNPLLGDRGAARTFGPQKGADADEIDVLEAALANFVRLTGIDPRRAGTGAAGGTGYALTLWGADIRGGAAEIAELLGARALIEDADLVITGEGRFDGSAHDGKAPSFLLEQAEAAGVPAAIIAGSFNSATPATVAAIALADLAGGARAATSRPHHWLTVATTSLIGRLSPSTPARARKE